MRTVLSVLLAAIIAAALNPAAAQRVQRIAAIVNDEVVSVYDLEARMKLIIASSGLKPTPQLRERLTRQVLRGLVDERLRMQEAKRRNISVTKSNLDRAIKLIEEQNRLSAGGLDSFLARNGIARETMMDQLRAQIAWGKLVNRRLRPRITIGDDEIDETMTRIKERQGEVEYRVAEILLTVDRPEQEQEIRRTARRLADELKRGARFAAVAQQFSQSASAASGGDLGWIQEGAMNDDLRRRVADMKEGDIAGPFAIPGALQIIRLSGKRRAHQASADDITVTLNQIMLPLPRDATEEAVQAQMSLARALSETVSGCKDLVRAAKEARAPGSPELGKLRLRDLSSAIRGAVETLPVGKASRPVKTPVGIAVMMVCDRQEPKTALPKRDEIQNRLLDDRLGMMARRYMRDLRSAAVVDLRV
jgi:peptidyl-prolyl cis-trans isomerase SurA